MRNHGHRSAHVLCSVHVLAALGSASCSHALSWSSKRFLEQQTVPRAAKRLFPREFEEGLAGA